MSRAVVGYVVAARGHYWSPTKRGGPLQPLQRKAHRETSHSDARALLRTARDVASLVGLERKDLRLRRVVREVRPWDVYGVRDGDIVEAQRAIPNSVHAEVLHLRGPLQGVRGGRAVTCVQRWRLVRRGLRPGEVVEHQDTRERVAFIGWRDGEPLTADALVVRAAEHAGGYDFEGDVVVRRLDPAQGWRRLGWPSTTVSLEPQVGDVWRDTRDGEEVEVLAHAVGDEWRLRVTRTAHHRPLVLRPVGYEMSGPFPSNRWRLASRRPLAEARAPRPVPDVAGVPLSPEVLAVVAALADLDRLVGWPVAQLHAQLSALQRTAAAANTAHGCQDVVAEISRAALQLGGWAHFMAQVRAAKEVRRG